MSVDTITFVKEALSLLFGSRAKDLNAETRRNHLSCFDLPRFAHTFLRASRTFITASDDSLSPPPTPRPLAGLAQVTQSRGKTRGRFDTRMILFLGGDLTLLVVKRIVNNRQIRIMIRPHVSVPRDEPACGTFLCLSLVEALARTRVLAPAPRRGPLTKRHLDTPFITLKFRFLSHQILLLSNMTGPG